MGESNEHSRCPEIDISLNGKAVTSLIVTGSEVTTISEKFYNANLEYLKSCPTLPLCRKFIKAATGTKSTRLKLQVMIPTKLNNIKLDLIYIVVPKLIKDCIIGIDTQEKLKMLIDTVAKNIKITVNDISDSISYNIMSAIESKQYSSLNIIECLDGKNGHKSLHSKADLEFQDYVDNEFDISIEEIEQKINTSDILSIEQKQILKRLIIKYKPLFLKKPGLINNYTHVLRMKDDTPFFSKPYPVPIHYRDKVEKEINNMLKLGIITFSKQLHKSNVSSPKEKW